MNIAPAIVTARKAVGWTVRELATRAGVSVGTIVAAEKGERDMTMGTVTQIAEAFGMQLVDLIGLASNLAAQNQEKAQLELEMRRIALQLINCDFDKEAETRGQRQENE